MNLRIQESKSCALTAWRHPTVCSSEKKWGGRRDSNPRPSEPQSDILTRLNYAHHMHFSDELPLHTHALAGSLLPANDALLARLQGFEPWTYGLEGRCSILLSYRRIQEFRSHIVTRIGAPVNTFLEKKPSYLFLPQQFLYFLPLPQGQGSLRPTWTDATKILEAR